MATGRQLFGFEAWFKRAVVLLGLPPSRFVFEVPVPMSCDRSLLLLSLSDPNYWFFLLICGGSSGY